MNCVSYEIALKLKAAGFPEPHQLMSSDIKVWAYAHNYSLLVRLPLSEWHLFAPTVADILPLMDADVFYSKGYKCFCVDMRHNGDKFVKSNNIHDAAALAWLHQNQK